MTSDYEKLNAASSPVEGIAGLWKRLRDEPLKPVGVPIPVDYCNLCSRAWKVSDKLGHCPSDGVLLHRRVAEVTGY